MTESKYLLTEDDGLPCRTSQPYARYKLSALKTYLEITTTAMKGKFSEICYLDLQSGPGKNRIGSEIVLGSPLISLMLPNPPSRFYFNEKSSSALTALKMRVKSSPLFEKVQFFDVDVIEAARLIRNKLPNQGKTSLNVAFIDPEGLEADWSVVEELAQVKRMDLIINFSTSGIRRSADNNPQAVDKFFGNSEWRAIWQKHSTHVRRELIDHYLAGLEKFGYIADVDPEWKGQEISVRNSKNSEVYSIIFASKHPLGDKFWKQSAKSTKQPKLPGFD